MHELCYFNEAYVNISKVTTNYVYIIYVNIFEVSGNLVLHYITHRQCYGSDKAIKYHSIEVT